MNTLHLHIGSDHGGFLMKQALITCLSEESIKMTDHGTYGLASVDYPQIAADVAGSVAVDPGSFGLLLCRSGEGMEMAANKVAGSRAALVWNEEVARETRLDNDANILVLPADFITLQVATACLRRFLATPFSDVARHGRRIAQLTALEKKDHAS